VEEELQAAQDALAAAFGEALDVLGGEEPEGFDGFENVEVSRGEGKRCVRLRARVARAEPQQL